MHRYQSSMLLCAIIFLALLEVHNVYGIDMNSMVPRFDCYRNKQPNCNEEFIHKYKNLSKSVTGLTPADTWFLMWTRKNPDLPEKLHKCAGKLPPDTNFNPKNDLIVILSPFTTGMCETAFQREWLAQFLIRGDYNVMGVDYTWGQRFDIETVNKNIKIVAQQTAIVLQNIQEQTGFPTEQIHLMGISLGAQLAGLIGNITSIGRITGIDPGGPGYTKETPLKDRLDPGDASYVEVWHANAGQCVPYLGIDYDAGDVDFWINDGLNQPSCYRYAFISMAKGDFFYSFASFLLPTLCSHVQSGQYYKVSINPGDCQFVGVKCDSYLEFEAGLCDSCGENGENCLIMGFDTYKYYKKTNEHQRYYVRTFEYCPYCNNTCLNLEGYESTYYSSLQTR